MPNSTATSPQLSWVNASNAKLERELIAKYGEAQRLRLERGLRQVGEFWRPEDGDAAAFEEFVRANFAGDQATLDTMFNRFERLLEQLGGHMHEINREFRQQMDLDLGPVLPFDEMFGGYDPSAHIIDDFFQNKLAFVVLLNFPLTTLDEPLKDGPRCSRRQWAEVRLAQRFSKRIPVDVNLGIAQAEGAAARYVAEYNIWMHHLIDENGQRLFPPKMRLLSHWNLRDEIKADYADKQDGLAKQRMIQQVMERIVTQTIPAVVVNNPNVDWNPFTNEAKLAAVKDSDSPVPASMNISSAREPDTRYATLQKDFLTSKRADPYSPTAPTLIARRFDEDREIPETRVKAMLDQVLTSPLVPQIAKLIESRLGRPLEPFDIWYNGFRPDSKYSESELDAIVAKKYPTAEAYQKDIPNLLVKLGFSPERAQYVAQDIVVDPARGSGHAMGAEMRSEKAHLRTRVEKTGMNYKDVVLLAVYSHMIDSFLYLPDYSIGHLIASQIEEQMKKAGEIGPEFERMAKMGDVTPDLWMENATGKPVGPDALLEATKRALSRVQ